jgi:hypothetical protein
VAFNGELSRDLAAHFLALAEKQQATTPLMIGHRNMGLSLWHAGKTAEARVHLDDAISLYDSSKHRALAVRFGQDVGASALATRTQVLWVLGYPEAALADADQAISDARKFGQAATFMYALCVTGLTRTFCRDYEAAIAQSDEVVPLAAEKGAALWKAFGTANKGCVLAASLRRAHELTPSSHALGSWRAIEAL